VGDDPILGAVILGVGVRAKAARPVQGVTVGLQGDEVGVIDGG